MIWMSRCGKLVQQALFLGAILLVAANAASPADTTFKQWPKVALTAGGCEAKLSTRWRQGLLLYRLRVGPLAEDQVRNYWKTGQFTIRFVDGSGFRLGDIAVRFCDTVVVSRGRTGFVVVEGNAASWCSFDQYQQFRRWTLLHGLPLQAKRRQSPLPSRVTRTQRSPEAAQYVATRQAHRLIKSGVSLSEIQRNASLWKHALVEVRGIIYACDEHGKGLRLTLNRYERDTSSYEVAADKETGDIFVIDVIERLPNSTVDIGRKVRVLARILTDQEKFERLQLVAVMSDQEACRMEKQERDRQLEQYFRRELGGNVTDSRSASPRE
jgi:hypothetical protein